MARNNERREEEILNAAVKVFFEKGFNASTTNEISKEAGIAEGTIFRYFKTKKDILTAVIEKFMDEVVPDQIVKPVIDIIEENRDRSEKELLFLILKDRAEFINYNMPIIKIALSEILVDSELRELWAGKIISRLSDVLKEYIQFKIEEGKFRDVDMKSSLRSLVGMMFVYKFQQYILPDLIMLEDEDTELKKIVDLFLNGMKK